MGLHYAPADESGHSLGIADEWRLVITPGAEMSGFHTFQIRALSFAAKLRFSPHLVNEAIAVLTATFGNDWLQSEDLSTSGIPLGFGGHPLRRDLKLAGENQVTNILELVEYLKVVPGATDPIVITNLKDAFGRAILQLAFAYRLMRTGTEQVGLEPPAAGGRVGDIGFRFHGHDFLVECYSVSATPTGDAQHEEVRLTTSIMVLTRDDDRVVAVAVRLAQPLTAAHRKAIVRALRPALSQSLIPPILLRVDGSVISIAQSVEVGPGQNSALVFHQDFDNEGQPDQLTRASYVPRSKAFSLTDRSFEAPTGSHVALWLDSETRRKRSIKKPLEEELEKLARKAERKLVQTRGDGMRRLLVISSWVAHEFDKATHESLDRLAGKLVRAHENVDGVLIVGRAWTYESDRHHYLIHPVVREESPGAEVCTALVELESHLRIPPVT